MNLSFLNVFFNSKSEKNKKTGKSIHHQYMNWWAVLFLTMFISIGTWNPMGIDFVHYILGRDYKDFFSYLEALIVLVIWGLGFVAIYKAVGKTGMVLMLVFTGLFFGGIVQRDWIDIGELSHVGWFTNISLGVMLWIGIMSPRIWKSITGQYTTTLAEGSSVDVEGEPRKDD